MNNSIVEQILQGSCQINVWREEIDTLLKILASIIREFNLHEGRKIQCNNDETCWWWIKTEGGHPISIHFMILDDGEHCVCNSHGSVIPSGHQVQGIRAKLDDLVKGLLTLFPWLSGKWEFLVNAAHAAKAAK